MSIIVVACHHYTPVWHVSCECSTTSYQNCNVIAVNPEALNYRNNPFRLKLDKQRVSLILIVMNYLEIKIRSLSVQ